MFDNYVSRWNTNSAKWDESRAATNSEDVISLSVADMDFQSSPAIIQEMVSFANHGIYGYSNVSEEYFSLTQAWTENQYNWSVDKEWIIFSPRVIQAVSLLIQRHTKIGDGVVVQSPSYGPLTNAIEVNERKVITNPLIYKDNRYKIDFKDLEKQFKMGAKIMLLISPQNPVGRVWNKDELLKIIKLCKKYNVLLISDEVHADFSWEKEFISVGKVLEQYDYENVVICMSPGKTFNIPGLEVTNIIIKNEQIREDFKKSLEQAGIHNPQFFAVPALEKAYGESEEWLDLVKGKIRENIHYISQFLEEKLPEFKLTEPEGTFTVWVNYEDTGLNEEELKEIIFEQAKVTVSLGSGFGSYGDGFFRINLALPKRRLEEAMNRILKSYKQGRKE